MTANDFLGLPKKNAQDLAERRNMIFRLVSVDGKEFLGWPTDQRDDRICCVIEDLKVSNAKIC